MAGKTTSRDDIRDTIQTFFHSQSVKNRSVPTVATKGTKPGAPGAPNRYTSSTRRMMAFLTVSKRKILQQTKLKFGNSNQPPQLSIPDAKKCFILCLSMIQDTISESPSTTTAGDHTARTFHSAQLHYMELTSSYSIEVRNTWELNKLEAVEVVFTSSPRGSFSLELQKGEDVYLWAVQETESDLSMKEFIWSLCALCLEQHSAIPRLVNVAVEELDHVADIADLTRKYQLNVSSIGDPVGHAEDMKAKQASSEADSDPHDLVDKLLGVGSMLTAQENEDLMTLFATVNWEDCHIQPLEEGLQRQLRELEDENIGFLLSFENDLDSTQSEAIYSGTSKKPVDQILDSNDQLQKRVEAIQSWLAGCTQSLEATSQTMKHFESLNNQLEVHYKNSVTLQQCLEQMLELVDLPPSVLDALSSFSISYCDGHEDDSGVVTRLQPVIAALHTLDVAFRSTLSFPASEMSAFRARREELSQIAQEFSEKVSRSLDNWFDEAVKYWKSNQAKSMDGGVPSIRSSGQASRPRGSKLLESDVTRSGRSGASQVEVEVHWTFSNEDFHSSIRRIKGLFAAIESLNHDGLVSIRQLYIKHVSQVYNQHMVSLFRYMREKLSRTAKSHHYLPAPLQSRSLNVSSSHSQLDGFLNASTLFQQVLDHLLPICLREEHFVLQTLLHPHLLTMEASMDRGNDDLAAIMELLFDKCLKRCIEFGDLAASRNIMEASSLIVNVAVWLATCQSHCNFLFHVLMQFQLYLKRILLKFTDDQEHWILSQNPDTKLASVLVPLQKIIAMITRLEESVDGKTEDPTFGAIIHQILPATTKWIEKIAASKPKYSHLTKLENYYFMHEKLTSPARNHPFNQYAEVAHAKYLENLKGYVEWIWNSELHQLAPLFQQVHTLLDTIPMPEIQFHVPRSSVVKVVNAFNTSFVKIDAKKMHDRMKKHFGSNSHMFSIAWRQFIEYADRQLEAYENIARNGYQLEFMPTTTAIDTLRKLKPE
uniref:Uncharacterized protein AlNc14C116G6535 n=1 Tax=Albugo laibachii Nc14 TaxID=890382 RepID=F0W090_9STRA|nr:conserved hypothetical protein [Albugo laibachii Nc14]CCA21245.1 conserved hypothetical protein [Albugo laibachii Nc14]|eukprot:CCA21245.1 conserved hypothetical protein [Albugo laibachii Nc14]